MKKQLYTVYTVHIRIQTSSICENKIKMASKEKERWPVIILFSHNYVLKCSGHVKLYMYTYFCQIIHI